MHDRLAPPPPGLSESCLYSESKHGHVWTTDQVHIDPERPDGSQQTISFVQRDGFVESEQEIPEPHNFVASLRLGHEHHSHEYDVEFAEQEGHHHHTIKGHKGLGIPE